MSCPKKEILSSLIYIQRLIDKGDLVLDNKKAEDITKTLSLLFTKAIDNVKKAKENEKNLISFNMYAKSVLYTMNYLLDKKPEIENITSKITLLKDKNFQFEKEYLNSDIVDLTFNFGDEDKVYLFNLYMIGNFEYEKSGREFRNLINNINFLSKKYGYNYSDIEYFTNKIINAVVNLILKRNKNEFEKDTIFYIRDTEIKFYFFTKKDIEKALEKYKNQNEDDILFSDLFKNHFDEIKEYFVEAIFNEWKKAQNKYATDSLISLINGNRRFISSNIPRFLQEYEDLLKLNNSIEFKIRTDTLILPNLVKDKEKNREYKPYIVFDFFKTQTDEDIPLKQKKIPLNLNEVTLEFDFKKKTIDIKNLNFNEKVNKLYEVNTAQNVSFYIPHTYKDNHFFNTLIDEVDRGTNGKINKILRYVTNGDDKTILIATGSPITARPKDLVPLIAFGIEGMDIEENMKNFTIQCGVFEIKDENISFIFNALNNKEISAFVTNVIDEYMAFSKNKEKTFNEVIYFFKKSQELMYKMEKSGLIDEIKIRNIDLFKFSKSFNMLVSGIANKKNLYNRNLLRDSFLKLFLENPKTYLKEVPEISNPKTLIFLLSSLGNPNISIMTREKLKGRKEHFEITDLKTYLNTLDEIKTHSVNEKTLINKNDLSIRLKKAGLEYLNYKYFIPQSMEYLTNLFKDFTMMFINDKEKKNNLKSLSNLFKMDIKDIKNYLEKTTISGNDDILSIYVRYLKLNGDFEKLKNEFVKDEYSKEKINFFKKFVKLFDYYFKSLPSFINEADKNSFSIGDNKFVKTGNYRYQAVFKTGGKEGKEFDTQNLQTEYGYPKQSGIIFSKDMEFAKDEYKDFLKPDKDGYYIKYNFEFTNPEENVLLDIRASKGIQEEIGKMLYEGKSFPVASARVGGLVFNLLDTIYQAQFRKNKSKPLSIIVNETSSNKFNLKEIISRIDEEYLRKNNIVITPVKRNLLEAQMKLDLKKDYQVVLLSNYESIARGIDLSVLGNEMIATGNMSKGGEFIQFSARTFSVDNDYSKMSMFHGGEDVDLFIKNIKDIDKNLTEFLLKSALSNIDEKEAIDFYEDYKDNFLEKETQTSKIQFDAVKKLNVYRMFMGGERTNMIDSDRKINSLVDIVDDDIERMLDEGESVNIASKLKR